MCCDPCCGPMASSGSETYECSLHREVVGGTFRSSGEARLLDTVHTSGGGSLLRIAARTLSKLQSTAVLNDLAGVAGL
jgi:hypothetical protein